MIEVFNIKHITGIRESITAPKSILCLIGFALAACLLGVLVPQINNTHPAYFTRLQKTSPAIYHWLDLLELNRVFTSHWFFLLAFLILFTLGLSLIRQYKKAIAAYSIGNGNTFFIPQLDMTIPGDGLLPLKEALLKKGFHAEHRGGAGDGFSLCLRRNRVSVWGNFLFHVGLLILILASLMSFSFQKWGFAQLIEGDTFSGREEDFLSLDKGLFAGRFDADAEFFLRRFTHGYWDTGEIKNLESDVTVYRKGLPPREYAITKKAPLSVEGINIYQSSNYGYTVKIALTRDGPMILPAYFSLDHAPRGKPLTGKSDYPTTDYDMDMTFYPDWKGGGVYPTKPVLFVRFFKGGREVAQKSLRPGDDAIVAGDRFRFEEVRNWSGLVFTQNRFMPFIYFGFFAVSVGPMLAFLFPFQETVVAAFPLAGGGYRVQAAVRSRMGRQQLKGDMMAVIGDHVADRMEKA